MYRARRDSNCPLKFSYTKEGQLAIRRAHPREVIYHAAKNRAKTKGLDFNITVEDIVIPEFCPYLGLRITNIKGEGAGIDSNASIDRIDCTKGYIVGNIQVISNKANRIKNNATAEELLVFATNVFKLHSQEVNFG